jgi:hypothetical protein
VEWSGVKNANYYTLMFDCTSDSSHKEQMSEILRYVYITERRVTIEEILLDFISTHEKTGPGLSTEILNKIEQDGLDIKNACGQSYENGAIWQEYIREFRPGCFLMR